KGSDYRTKLGLLYEIRTGALLVLCALAIKIKSQRFHAAFAVFAVILEVILISKLYVTVR
ncbi:MAG TPA: hypothetical protein VHT24_05295, partial [Pseudacidobacterium sp.]|nr:hypothetical protein [Pseudacidobacterium sp.]